MGLIALCLEAEQSANSRGHIINWDSTPHQFRKQGVCLMCGDVVEVKINLQPNEIEIAGTAVALNCRFIAEF